MTNQAYPATPAAGRTDTSAEAAEMLAPSVETIRAQVFEYIRNTTDGATADEAADDLGLSILTVRPRFTELKRLGQIVDSEQRRRNWRSNRTAIVWKAADRV